MEGSAVTRYADDVISGRIVAGRLVRLACERHLRDLEHGHERGLSFDNAAAERVFRFFEQWLRLKEGEFAGKPFRLEPSQRFIVGSLFGWKREDGYRRFRTGYIEEGKGAGKSPLLAGIGIYGLMADGEEGAELYSAAVTRDQANILFHDAKAMIERSPALASKLDVNVGNIAYPALGAYFRPVSHQAKSLDGKRVHMALIDELHEHQSGEAVDKMRAGTKARRQPLLLEITNAGYDQHTICWEHHEYSQKVLEQVYEDDEWFGYVCGLDACEECRAAGRQFPQDGCSDCDDWRDEAVWPKANPLLGVTIQPQYLRGQVREAERMPSAKALLLRLNFCIWTQAKNPWLSMDLWAAGSKPFELKSLVGRRCFGGLDLSSTYDLTAFVLLFPPEEEGEGWYVVPRFWCPEDNLYERVRNDHVPYDVWLEQGYLEATPGNVVDYDFVEVAIKESAGLYRIERVQYDRWAAEQIYQHLADDGLEMVPMGQGFASMAAPCKELERMVAGGKLRHGGHPVLTWNASNTMTTTDPAGNLKPIKSDPKKRIDGIAALLMAVDAALRSPETSGSVYEERGIVVLGDAPSVPPGVECPACPACAHLPGMHEFRGSPDDRKLYCYDCEAVCVMAPATVVALWQAWS